MNVERLTYMSEKIDSEIADLISEVAEKHDVPSELLRDIYIAESRVVNMERRGRIYKRVSELLENHIEESKISS